MGGVEGEAIPGVAGRKDADVGGCGVLATRCVPEIRRGVVGGFVPGELAGDEGVGRRGGCTSTGRIRLDDGPAFAGEAGCLPI